MAQITGICTYADGLPFDGTLRLLRTDGNALENIWREIPIVNGIVPDYLKLSPGIYTVQWLATNPNGLIPTEEWVIPESDTINIREMRNTLSLPNIIEQKDATILALQIEISKLRAEIQSLKTPTKIVSTENQIQAEIQAIKEGLG